MKADIRKGNADNGKNYAPQNLQNSNQILFVILGSALAGFVIGVVLMLAFREIHL